MHSASLMRNQTRTHCATTNQHPVSAAAIIHRATSDGVKPLSVLNKVWLASAEGIFPGVMPNDSLRPSLAAAAASLSTSFSNLIKRNTCAHWAIYRVPGKRKILFPPSLRGIFSFAYTLERPAHAFRVRNASWTEKCAS